jgi:hypothetical protein
MERGKRQRSSYDEQKTPEHASSVYILNGALSDSRNRYAAYMHLLKMTRGTQKTALAWIKERSQFVASILDGIFIRWDQSTAGDVATENLILWLTQQLVADSLIPDTDAMIAENALFADVTDTFNPQSDPQLNEGLFLTMAVKVADHLLVDRKYRLAMERLGRWEQQNIRGAAEVEAEKIILNALPQLASCRVECTPENANRLLHSMVQENAISQYTDQFSAWLRTVFGRSAVVPELPSYLGNLNSIYASISDDGQMPPHEYATQNSPFADADEDLSRTLLQTSALPDWSATELVCEEGPLSMDGTEMLPLTRH